MNSIENEHPGIRPAENDEPDDRALQIIAQGLGKEAETDIDVRIAEKMADLGEIKGLMERYTKA